MTNAANQLKAAANFGREAFHANIKCAPALDAKVMALLGSGRKIGETPEGEAGTCDIFEAWLKAWHKENLTSAAGCFSARTRSLRRLT